MDLVEEVKKLISDETKREFDSRVKEQADSLNSWVKENKFDNKGFSIGLELEAYVLDQNDLVRKIPKKLFEKSIFAPELGKQNIEINTVPHIFNEKGVGNQLIDLKNKFIRSKRLLRSRGLNLILDSLSTSYVGFNDFFHDIKQKEGLVFAKNMTEAPRYYGIDNAVLNRKNGSISFDVPGVDLNFPSLLFESLTTSMQVHLQVPDPKKFVEYYNKATRVMAPLLALSTNSPLLPPSFYDEIPTEFYHENRVPIFEQSVNPSDEYSEKKVRFPEEIEEFNEFTKAVERDETYTACLREWKNINESKKGFWEWNYKLKEFWRWIRPVFGGESVKDCCSKNSIRIEFRPLPTQPSLKETISLKLLTAGLIHGLVINNHPLNELNWKKSKKDFYEVVKNGLNSKIHWITKKGDKTTNKDVIFNELFDFAKKGLKNLKIDEKTIDYYLDPVEKRWTKKITPSKWKLNILKEKLENKNYAQSIKEVTKQYREQSYIKNEFTDWI